MRSNKSRMLVALILVLVMAFPNFIYAADNLGKLGNTVVLYIGSNKALVNNQEKVIDAANSTIVPIIEGGRTLVPIRFVSENMGMKVDWDNATRSITITYGSNVIKMQIDSKAMSKNGAAFTSDAAPRIKNGKTLVPLRIISESFGKNVFFDRNLIIISEKENVFNITADKSIVDGLILRYKPAGKLTVEEISRLDKSVVVIYSLDKNGEIESQGSGFCIAPGIFVTNYHVIEEASRLQIETEDNKKYEVEGIVAADIISDLALIKTKTNPNIPALKLGIDKESTKGQQIVTIGSPEGLKNTVSEGIISGFRNDTGIELIQISAPITYGSSGSPLFNMYGDVIGINSSGLDAGNLNFAISVNHIRDWYNRIAGLPYTGIQIIGKESCTKDPKISDAEVINTLKALAAAYNSKDYSGYMSFFNYESENLKEEDIDALISTFKTYDIELKIENPSVIKKTSAETLVRAEMSYTSRNQEVYYRDNKIGVLLYLKKVGSQWKVYRMDTEKIIYIEGADGTAGYPGTDAEQNTESPVTVITPENSTGTKLPESPVVTGTTGSNSGASEIDVSMAINSFKYNKSNNKIYALNTANKKLIIIDAGSKKVDKIVGLKYKPSDLAVSSDNKYLYVVNEGSNNILEISLSDYSVKREFLWDAETYGREPYHYHIEYYNNKLFLVDAKWAPSLWVLDLKTMNITDFGQNTNSNDIATDKIDNVGDLIIDQESGELFFWQQYGWDAGYAGSNILRYEIGDTEVNQLDEAGLGYPMFGRDPLDTPIMLVKEKNWVIAKSYVLNMNNLKQKYYKFDEDLYAVDFKGKYAVSKENIYDMDSFDKIGAVPLKNADFYFFDSAGTLYMVDNKNSTIKYYTIK